MSNKDLNIKKYIYSLSIIIFSGILLFMLTHNLFHHFLDNLNLEKKNVRNRFEISQVIIENINLIEKDYYNIFIVKSGVAKDIIIERTQKHYNTIYDAIDVLENGGTLSVSTNLNLGEKFKFQDLIEFYPEDNSITLEAIEIKPKLNELRKMLTEIIRLTDERDKVIDEKRKIEELEVLKGEIYLFSRKTSSYFYRLKENANRSFYFGTLKLKAIDEEISKNREYYTWLEKIFLFLVSVIMVAFSSVIIRKINQTNRQLFSAKQEIRTAMEELETTHAQLIQEVAEKELAEEALQISEHRLLTMWNSIHSGVLLIRKDNHNIVDCNPSAQKMISLSMNNITGNSCHNFILTSEGEGCSYDQSSSNYTYDCFLNTSSGRMIPILKTEVPLVLNEMEYWLVSFTDVTILKEAEKVLIKSKEQAENADKLKSVFLAQMSHEIRTPINVMLSMTSLLQLETEGKLDEEQNSYFGIINNSGSRIIRTVDLLINLSEVQAGTYTPIIKRFDLYSDVLTALLLEYKKRAMEKGIAFIINFNTEDAFLHGDIYTIEQIFIQLLDNAIMFTETGKISITILRDNSNKLVVETKDTGIGISDEYFKDIFKPFTQEDMGYSRKFDGNGIGLSLVKSYCDLNNAIIKVESEKGVGSTFRIIFS